MPHCPRRSCHGCTPPGEAFERSMETLVFPLLEPGVIAAEPCICTAPTRLAGDASVPLQRAFAFASRVLTWTTGACLNGLRNGLHAVVTSPPAARTSSSGERFMASLQRGPDDVC